MGSKIKNHFYLLNSTKYVGSFAEPSHYFLLSYLPMMDSIRQRLRAM